MALGVAEVKDVTTLMGEVRATTDTGDDDDDELGVIAATGALTTAAEGAENEKGGKDAWVKAKAPAGVTSLRRIKIWGESFLRLLPLDDKTFSGFIDNAGGYWTALAQDSEWRWRKKRRWKEKK